MEIDFRDEQNENAESLIPASCESDSNITVESELHAWKQDLQRISTDGGIETDTSDEQHENA
jgi:hypothetical protein